MRGRELSFLACNPENQGGCAAMRESWGGKQAAAPPRTLVWAKRAARRGIESKTNESE